MDIFAKKLGEIKPEIINGFYGNGNMRPFFMTKDEVDEMNIVNNNGKFDMICWEGNIIMQLWSNEYNWFDKSKCLIDIGAGAGEYPIFGGFEHSYAFEPNRKKQALIWANMLSSDKLDEVDVLPYAISDYPGIRAFSGWSEDIDNHPSEKPQYIEYRTLDSFNIRNVGLIKIDIEGFEYNAICSGLATIVENNYPPLLIEVWDEKNMNGFFPPDKLIDYKNRQQKLLILLDSLGYVKIEDPRFGDWETFFFIHKNQLNGWTKPKEQ